MDVLVESALDEELMSEFHQATEWVKNKGMTLDSSLLLYFYGRYKRAKDGKCNIEKPGFFDFQGKQKWQAWKDCDDLSLEEAMLQYVEKVTELDPDFHDKKPEDDDKNKAWVSVSSMPNEETELEDKDKNIFHFVQEGRVDKVKELLEKESFKDAIDDNGLGLLHWAADRGQLAMMEMLIDSLANDEKISNLNSQDNDGQTPLHYAASCGHIHIVKCLLKEKADSHIKDNEGFKPLDIADDAEIKSILVSNVDL